MEDQAATDCPECEYCCAIGLCCPPARQLEAATKLFMRITGESEAECRKYAHALVTAKKQASKE